MTGDRADGPTPALSAIACVPNLMDRSKVAALPGVVFQQIAQLRGVTAALVVVDLSVPGMLEVLGSIRSPRIIGFASHVERDLIAEARQAGCTEVLTRAAFFRAWPGLAGATQPEP